MNEKIIKMGIIGIMIGLIFVMGFLISYFYFYGSYKQYDGCWADVKSGDDKGEWICVNIEGMKPRRAFTVVNHEIGHSIFANYCEDNIEKCLSITDETKEK